MVKYLSKMKDVNKHINELTNWMAEQEYDTDTVKFDVGDVGNVLNHIKNQDLQTSVKNIFDAVQSYSSSFNVGVRFYYWPYYKKIKDIPQEEQVSGLMNEHDGHDICELYVQQRYTSFKEEVSNYNYFNMK
eukprot:87539_1